MAVGEWDQRELCPDGGCVGVIGPDGSCKVCGRAAVNWGNERAVPRIGSDAVESDSGVDDDDDEYEDDDESGEYEDDEDDDEYEDDDEPASDDHADLLPSAPALLGEAKEWNQRQLCSDGSCVGVIGRDGRCKVCGKSASGEPSVTSAETSSDDAEMLAAATDLAASLEEQRKLCPDGACTGVIGPDDKCKTCGKQAA